MARQDLFFFVCFFKSNNPLLHPNNFHTVPKVKRIQLYVLKVMNMTICQSLI